MESTRRLQALSPDTPTGEHLDVEIRKLLARVMRSPECNLSRIEVAQALSLRIDPRCEIDRDSLQGAGLPVSLHMLNAYCAQHEAKSGKKLRFPAFLVPAFCEVVGDFHLMRLIVGPHLEKLREVDAKRKSEQRKKTKRRK